MGEVYITHTASFLPNDAIENDSMEELLGVIGDRPSRTRRVVLRNNKIRRRYYAIDPATGEPSHNNAQMTAEAVRGLLDDELQLNDIQCLACGTSVPDQIMPGHASMVHGELRSPQCEVVSTGGVCVSGMAALKYAYLSVLSGQTPTAVASGSERISALTRSTRFEGVGADCEEQLERAPELAFGKDFLRWMLSDGAGAMALRSSPRKNGLSLRINWVHQSSYANELDTCMYTGAHKREDGSLQSWLDVSPDQARELGMMNITQDVKQLNSNIVRMTLERPLAELIDSKHLYADDIDYFLPHYSSGYFRQPVFDCLQQLGFEIPFERWFTNLSEKGNTGAASIFIMLDELFRSGRLESGQKLLCFVPESGRFATAFMLLTVCDAG